MESVMLTNYDSRVNAAKFYQMELTDDGIVKVTYGRVGNAGQSASYPGGKAKFDSLRRAKERKGYEVTKVADSTSTSGAKNAKLEDAAKYLMDGG